MTTKEVAFKHLEFLGWKVLEFNYDKPRTGFKCIEGGYTCQVNADKNDYDNLSKIRFNNGLIGSIEPFGFIQSLSSKDFIRLVKRMPKKCTSAK